MDVDSFVDIWLFIILCALIFVLLTYFSHSSNPNIKIDFNANLAIAKQNDRENIENENIQDQQENNNSPTSCPIIKTPTIEIISAKRERRPPIRFSEENYY